MDKPTYMTFLESKNQVGQFLDSEVRILKRYCHDNDGVVKLFFIGDNQVAEMQFSPGEWNRLEVIRKPDKYVLKLLSDGRVTNGKKLDFSSFEDLMKFVEEET